MAGSLQADLRVVLIPAFAADNGDDEPNMGVSRTEVMAAAMMLERNEVFIFN